MRNYTCSECGQINGHFWNCPETPEPEDADVIQAEAEPEDDEQIS